MVEFFKDPRVVNSKRILWPGKKPSDKPELQDLQLLAVIAKYGFKVKTGINCYELINSKGDVLEVPFGDNDWAGACEELEKRCGR